MYDAGNEKVYMHYLVFYESLEDAYYPSYTLFKDVLDEIDTIDDFDQVPATPVPVSANFLSPEPKSNLSNL
jgi:hypothetical protein